MKLMWFHLMPYTELPEDFKEKHPSVQGNRIWNCLRLIEGLPDAAKMDSTPAGQNNTLWGYRGAVCRLLGRPGGSAMRQCGSA